MKLFLNILWIGALIWILALDALAIGMVLSGNSGDGLDWLAVILANLIVFSAIFLLKTKAPKYFDGKDYISLWFKVLKIRFLNWKDSSKQKMEEEIERNSQQDTNDAQSTSNENNERD